MQRQNIFVGIKLCQKQNGVQSHKNKSDSSQIFSIRQNELILKNKQSLTKYKLDCCLNKNTGNQTIYDNLCLNLVQDFIDGYDINIIFCRNTHQPNSVKNVLLGYQTQQSKGIIPRMIDHITSTINYFKHKKFLIKVSYLEIYQQEMFDLLSIKKTKLEIKHNKNNKNDYVVHNLQIKTICQLDEIQANLLIGNRKKQYAYSKNLRKVQYSTSFFTIYLQSYQQNGSIYRSSKFNFCELAPVFFENNQLIEFQKSSQKFYQQRFLTKTFQNSNSLLNLSYLSLQNVVNSLVYGDQTSSIPYSDSKVTKLLHKGLGGQSKTSIIGLIYGEQEEQILTSIKILKTLSLCSQIQTRPSNIKQYNRQNSHQQSLISQLEQICHLSNKLQSQKISLQMLLNNQSFIKNQLNKIKTKNENLIDQNQFCDQKQIQKHLIQQKTQKQWEYKQNVKQLQKKIHHKINYIFNYQYISQHKFQQHNNNADQVNENTQQLISQRKDILLRIKNIKEQRLKAMLNNDISPLDRQTKRQIFILQIQFQRQRQSYTSTIRNLQQKLSFYKSIAQKTLKKEQIQIIKINSKYDQTKRTFQIPTFSIKDKKIASGNFNSPLTLQRKFFVSPRSSSHNSVYTSNKILKKFPIDPSKKPNLMKSVRSAKLLSRNGKDQQNGQYMNQNTERKEIKKFKFTGFSKAKQLANKPYQSPSSKNIDEQIRSQYEIGTNMFKKSNLQKQNKRIQKQNKRIQKQKKQIQKQLKTSLDKRQKLTPQLATQKRSTQKSPANRKLINPKWNN